MVPLFKYRDCPVVSFCFLDRIRHHAEDDPEATLLSALEKAHQDTFGKPLDPTRAEWIANQLPKPSTGKSETSGKSPDKGLGSDLMKWLGQRSTDHLCYLLADFDVDKATSLYFYTDYRLVQDLGQVYLENRWQQLQANFEGSMYGFGGGYKDSSSSSASASAPGGGERKVYDLTDPHTRGKALKALKQLNWTE